MTSLANDPIIVLGAPRSGTTYLQRIIDRHPQVALTNEVRLFEWLHRALAQADDERALLNQRDAFRDHLRAELPAMVRRYYEELAPTALWWGDKNPHYAESEATLQTIVSLFPGARFIHIVRDPRAVVTSLMRKKHLDGTDWTHPEYAHELTGQHLGIASKFGADRGTEHFYEFRYEDLVADDEGVAKALFEWLRIPFTEEVASFCREQRIERTSFSGPTTDLSQAGDRDAVRAAWAALAQPAEQHRSLEFLAPYLLQFGYETRESLEDIFKTLGKPRDAQ